MTRVAVVTGAAGGIGRATCDLLEEEGWTVVAVDRQHDDRPGAVQVDIADADAVAAAIGDLPRIDALVNNAALQHFHAIEDTTIEDWDLVQAVNARGPFACLRAALPQLRQRGGAVVNVASVHAQATSRAIAAYAASKGALVAFTRAAALELASEGIRVNAVIPGAIDTPALRDGFLRSVDAGEAERILVSATPLGRIGRPRDIAHAISFLLDGERAAFITGSTMVVDGGVLARLASE